MKRTTAARTAAFALAAALTMSACSQEEPATFDDTAEQQGTASQDETPAAGEDAASTTEDAASTAEQGAPEDEEENVSDDSAAAAGVDPAELGDPIATGAVPAVVEGDDDATMEISLYSLTRDGQTLTGIFSFRVDTEGGSEDPRWIYHYLGSKSWFPHLIDTTNLARHDVLGSSGVRAITDSQGVKFRPGQTFYAYASFAAPDEDITTMTVSLVDGAPVATDVPIQ